MFQIIIHATGSKGNAYSICDGDHKILIDPGIRFKDLQKKTDFTLSKYDFALISHEHKDHCRAMVDIARLGIPIAMSLGTYNARQNDQSKMGSLPILLESENPWTFDRWSILPFNIQHDAAEPLGFLIQSPSGKKIVYATDTYFIKYIFSGVTHWMVEANYSEALLQKNNDLDAATKSRIRTSHFEIENVKKFFAAQDLSATEKIYLIHLSDQNSDEKIFVKEVEALTGKPVFTQ